MSGVRLVIHFTADSAERAEQAIAGTIERCRQAQQEDGCLQFEVFRSALDPARYVLLEHWDSAEALAAHAARNAGAPPRRTPGVTRVREDYTYSETS
jgi:quinol monooxygenase YgiN